jgi:hypothetical protein
MFQGVFKKDGICKTTSFIEQKMESSSLIACLTNTVTGRDGVGHEAHSGRFHFSQN